jgi:hypothetical protein
VVTGVVTVVLFFGWRQLPDISRSLGGRRPYAAATGI